MKLLIFIYSLFLLPPLEIYTIQFQSATGQKISMSDYKGKKILVATVDAGKPSEVQFQFLDSLQKESNDLQVLIIPANDQSAESDNKVLEVSRTLNSKLMVAQSAKTSKKAEGEQHLLCQWLTKVENNTHFNVDARPGQYFLISAQGTMYGLLESGAPDSVVLKALRIKFDESQHYNHTPETHKYAPKQ